MAEDEVESLRMADRQPHVAALDLLAEQLARRAIGHRDSTAGDDDRRLVERIDHQPHVDRLVEHAGPCSQSPSPRHVRKKSGPLT
jgi:hypothetical protein